MGVGKSTVGKILAEKLNWEYIDNDLEISKMAQLSLDQLAELDVTTLHALEAKYLWDVLSRPGPLIAGAAASVADNFELVNALKNEFTVYLYMPIESHQIRAGSKGVGRQGLIDKPTDVIRQRFERRDPRYRQVASLIVETTRNSHRDAELIIEKLRK